MRTIAFLASFKRWLWVWVLSAWLLSACAGASPDIAGEAVGVETTPTSSSNTDDSDTQEIAPRAELVATDPSTVALAAGKPQLIEFFAFW